jgi:UDP-N-acetylmuramate dehydrogenase
MTKHLNLQTLHPLKDYTTLNIGGLARFFCIISSKEEYLEVLDFSKKVNLPIFFLGKGSNTLFIDPVFEAIVVVNRINHCLFELPQVIAGSGYNISLLSSKASRKGYSGLEGASGIPASVGGAVFMNAGAGTFQTQDCLNWVKSIDDQGREIVREKDKLEFSYRHSMFHELNEFIYEAGFILSKSDQAWDLQQSIIKKRISSQPYKSSSAGCFFKNPEGKSAGALIDQCGLKGYTVGQAQVSDIHANFLINQKDCTPEDLLNLANVVKQKVFEKTGIQLEQEVRLIGNYIYEKV